MDDSDLYVIYMHSDLIRVIRAEMNGRIDRSAVSPGPAKEDTYHTRLNSSTAVLQDEFWMGPPQIHGPCHELRPLEHKIQNTL